MVISANALAIVSYTAMLIACALFLFALVKFYKAQQDEAAVRLFEGFSLFRTRLPCAWFLQALLLAFIDSTTKVNATYAAVFFLLFGAAASFIGEKLKPKPKGRN